MTTAITTDGYHERLADINPRIGQNPLSVARRDETPQDITPCKEHNVRCRFLLQERGSESSAMCDSVGCIRPCH